MTPALDCRHVRPSRHVPGLLEDARAGLLSRPRRLSPKYFYDARGSYLFDRICHTPEYYPTRVEAALLERHAKDIVERVRPAHLVELGAGASRKTPHLFDACAALGCHPRYWPFDVCEEILVDTALRLQAAYPWLAVTPLVGDYLGGLDDLPAIKGPTLYAFLGGTLGNFEEAEAIRFLVDVRGRIAPGDRMLLGVDRAKPVEVLEAAYNDAEGVTAAFNLNLLDVLNRELDADFDTGAFEHRASYNAEAQRIEMHLVSREAQRVRLRALDATIGFEAGETVRTEISRKFTPQSLRALIERAGLWIEHLFEPPDGYFSLALLEPVE
ncbi:MAG: L-histidine N(alpha)-methyltransferase [Gammaproteobacteria bacterium]|nr:L-histidine N(alpha)-methyltransferase [Gammaproteobacteria bacterium]